MKVLRFFLILTVLQLAFSLGVAIYFYPRGGVVLGFVLLAMAGRKTVQLSAHGTARFADASDIPHMLEGPGLIIGHIAGKPSKMAGLRALFSRLPDRWAVQKFLASCQRRPPRHLVRLTNAVHTAVFAPTGVGKGVSCVIPYLLTSTDSCVIVDYKGELAEKTARYRRDKFGHRIVLLNPYGVLAKPGQPLHEFQQHTLNPLDLLNRNSEFVIDDCADLANQLVVRKGTEHEPQWNDNAEKWIKIISAFLVNTGEKASLQNVKDIVSNPQYIERAIQSMAASPAWDGLLSRMGNELRHFKDKELGSVLTTTNRHLQFLDTLAISANTRESSFDPSELLTGKMTIYLILPPDRMRAQAGVMRMWLGAMFRAVIKEGPQENRLVHYILDECASSGPLEALNDAIDKYRGYGVRLQMYWQSQGQLKASFPSDEGQTMLSNCSTVYFGVNDQQTAAYVSQRLGQETIYLDSSGTSKGGSYSSDGKGSSTNGSNWGTSTNRAQHGKPLLRPEQVERLHPRIAITFTPGVPPLMTRLIRYYENDFKITSGMGLWRAAFDTACLFLATAFVAYLATLALLNEPGPIRSYFNNEVNHVQVDRGDPRSGSDHPAIAGERREFRLGNAQPQAVLQGGWRGTQPPGRSGRP
jgi:type IV secretion system protein VirD4